MKKVKATAKETCQRIKEVYEFANQVKFALLQREKQVSGKSSI